MINMQLEHVVALACQLHPRRVLELAWVPGDTTARCYVRDHMGWEQVFTSPRPVWQYADGKA